MAGIGSGSGDGDGSGYGYGDGYEIVLSQDAAFKMFHFIRKHGNDYQLRNGKTCKVGECLHEPEIAMCDKGLHASFSIADAERYTPSGSVLTKVAIWGRVIIGNDKVVATDRMIVCEV